MISLDYAVVYDVETTPIVFTMNAIGLYSDLDITFEISHYRDDRRELFAWFSFWQQHQIPMFGFNNIGFDYPVLHEIYQNPHITVEEIYAHAMMIIQSSNASGGRFGYTVWESDRFAPQIDLFKVHHFDNAAKRTSLKALQVNMRSDNVMECPLPFDKPLTKEQVDTVLIPYNKHDVAETKKFALISLEAIKFRLGLMSTIDGDVLNFSDSKLGSKIMEQRLGDDVCYTRDETGRRVPRQTPRDRIALADIIFPYVEFQHPEFRRVLDWMRGQVLTPDELSESETIRTKGVFTGVHATVGGLDFHFGTGGIHGSVSAQRIVADDAFGIYDIDVASLYPNLAIQNGLYPEHLGEAFVREYANLPKERKEWQAKKGKKCVEANAMKLAANGTYGNSNNKYSVFYDPKYTLTITINGQLLLCMLAEWLLRVPTLQIIQINTDGITYHCHRSMAKHAETVRTIWERRTRLVLEEAQYKRMWIRDVNNYVAEPVQGDLKQKGAYWFARKFPDDIANSQPPAWHKDFSAVVCTKAAVEHMVTGVDIERFVYAHRDPFDFMCRAKVDRSSRLMLGDREVQRITRYYVAVNGNDLKKISPPVKGAKVGAYTKARGVSDHEYAAVMAETGGAWDARVCTKNKSQYKIREFAIEAGYKVAECNRASDFDFSNVNYAWYVENARKLVIT